MVVFSNENRKGQALRGGRCKTSLGAASPGWLVRGGEIKARGTSRGSCEASRDDCGQAGASAHSLLASSLVLRRQAHARSTEASGKGFHIGATRPRPAGRQDGGHRGAHDGVTTRAFGTRRPPLVRIACTSSPPSNWPLWNPFPLVTYDLCIRKPHHSSLKTRVLPFPARALLRLKWS